jgi:hypothetical protein
VVLAANDGITLDSLLDGQDLYRPYLQLVMSSIETAPQPSRDSAPPSTRRPLP